MRLFAVLSLSVLLAACGHTIPVRDRVVDRLVFEWCRLSEAEQVVLAQRREYTPEFVSYMDRRCPGVPEVPGG